ncbi:MAG TPA: YceD family protein [Methylophilaceae bacterium]|nr:YceD family protein [Methylophilaceae bacterium]
MSDNDQPESRYLINLGFDTKANKLYHAALMTAQHIINSIEFARKALEIHDTIAVSQFPRLHDALSSHESVLDWQLLGDVSEGKPVLHLQVRGALELTCQRCLEPLKFDLNVSSDFIIVANEAALPPEGEDVDEQDYLVADAQMQVAELIEDEVLLALPYSPKHALNECGAKDRVTELKKPSPFAVLQSLKAGKNQN